MFFFMKSNQSANFLIYTGSNQSANVLFLIVIQESMPFQYYHLTNACHFWIAVSLPFHAVMF
jgi:hypothetical protein